MPESRITMYGTVWCGDCKRAKTFLGEQRIQYDYVDVERGGVGGQAGITERLDNFPRLSRGRLRGRVR
jgi:glutaredoxin-related protein